MWGLIVVTDVTVINSTQLLEVVRSMNKNGSKAIKKLCVEGDSLLEVDNNSLRESGIKM